MNFFITISTKGQPTTMIDISGVDFAWEKYSTLAEELEGLAAVQLVDAETAEIIASNEEDCQFKLTIFAFVKLPKREMKNLVNLPLDKNCGKWYNWPARVWFFGAEIFYYTSCSVICQQASCTNI